MQDPKITTYKDAINDLKTSPMFNLSLSSKELFHSNFLYWLSIVSRQSFKELMKELGVDTHIWIEKEWEVRREYNNLDLCVVQENKILLVVENKVKSIPSKKQLFDYDEKIKKANNGIDLSKNNKILLSLTIPTSNNDNWEWKGYDKISDFLSNIKLENEYHQKLIEDYVKFVNKLLYLIKIWEQSTNDNEIFLLDYKVKETNDDVEEKTNCDCDRMLIAPSYYKQAQELRIHDLFGKYRTSILNEKLKKLIETKQIITDFKIETNIAYTRAQPILEVIISGGNIGLKEDEKLFISLQGNQYRHAVLAEYNNDATDKDSRIKGSVERTKVLSKVLKGFIDLDISTPSDVNKLKYPEFLGKTGQRKVYCSYDNKEGASYIYQWKKIPTASKVNEVLNAIVEDVTNLIDALK